MKLKICPRCRMEKKTNEFHHNKTSSDGRSFYCKECMRKAVKESGEKEQEQKVVVKQVKDNRTPIKQRLFGVCEFCHYPIYINMGLHQKLFHTEQVSKC